MSDKTIVEKLLIKPKYKVLVVNMPPNYQTMLSDLPSEANLLTQSKEPVDLIQVFLTSRGEMEKQLEKLKQALKPNGLLWVTYPKGTSKVKCDINRDSIAAYARTIGLQAIAMISIDDTWSALRLKTV